MSETKHTWVDGPHGYRYHCRNCGISKTNDYSFYDTCELWTEHAQNIANSSDGKRLWVDTHSQRIAEFEAQIAALTAELLASAARVTAQSQELNAQHATLQALTAELDAVRQKLKESKDFFKDKINVSDIVKEYFPDADDNAVGYIIWNETGWPRFWKTNDWQACIREQLDALSKRKGADEQINS